MRDKMNIGELLRTAGQIRSRSCLLARKYSLLGRRKMSGNALHLGRAFRELGISEKRDRGQLLVGNSIAPNDRWIEEVTVANASSLRVLGVSRAGKGKSKDAQSAGAASPSAPALYWIPAGGFQVGVLNRGSSPHSAMSSTY